MSFFDTEFFKVYDNTFWGVGKLIRAEKNEISVGTIIVHLCGSMIQHFIRIFQIKSFEFFHFGTAVPSNDALTFKKSLNWKKNMNYYLKMIS